MSNLAVVYGALGKYAQSEALDTQVSEIRSRVLGAQHPATLMSMNNLAHDYLAQGKPAQAKRSTIDPGEKGSVLGQASRHADVSESGR
jgi:hypothetical protein